MSLVNDALKRAKESHDQQAPQPTATKPAQPANLGPAPRSSRVWIFALLAFLAAIGLAIGGVAYLKKQNQIVGSTTASEPGFFAKLKEKFSKKKSDQPTTEPTGEPTGPHIVIITKTSTNISEPTKSGRFEPIAPPPAPVVVAPPTKTNTPDPTKTNTLVVDNSKLTLLPEAARPEAPRFVQPPEAIKLQGILYSRTRPAAILNGRTVYVGDRISGMTVANIREKEVTLLYQTNPIVIKLP